MPPVIGQEDSQLPEEIPLLIASLIVKTYDFPSGNFLRPLYFSEQTLGIHRILFSECDFSRNPNLSKFSCFLSTFSVKWRVGILKKSCEPQTPNFR